MVYTKLLYFDVEGEQMTPVIGFTNGIREAGRLQVKVLTQKSNHPEGLGWGSLHELKNNTPLRDGPDEFNKDNSRPVEQPWDENQTFKKGQNVFAIIDELVGYVRAEIIDFDYRKTPILASRVVDIKLRVKTDLWGKAIERAIKRRESDRNELDALLKINQTRRSARATCFLTTGPYHLKTTHRRKGKCRARCRSRKQKPSQVYTPEITETQTDSNKVNNPTKFKGAVNEDEEVWATIPIIGPVRATVKRNDYKIWNKLPLHFGNGWKTDGKPANIRISPEVWNRTIERQIGTFKEGFPGIDTRRLENEWLAVQKRFSDLQKLAEQKRTDMIVKNTTIIRPLGDCYTCKQRGENTPATFMGGYARGNNTCDKCYDAEKAESWNH